LLWVLVSGSLTLVMSSLVTILVFASLKKYASLPHTLPKLYLDLGLINYLLNFYCLSYEKTEWLAFIGYLLLVGLWVANLVSNSNPVF